MRSDRRDGALGQGRLADPCAFEAMNHDKELGTTTRNW